MIMLLTCLVLVEGGIALLLMVQFAPLRRLLMKGLDSLKTGRGSAIVKTFVGTMVIMLASTINSIYKIERRILKLGSPTPIDHFMLRTHLLEASLMGFCLFSALIINRLHHYLREINSTRINMEALKKQARAAESEYLRLKNEQASSHEKEKDDNAALAEIESLRQNVDELQVKLNANEKAAKAAEANAKALQKQSEGFLLEYDRLLEDNQYLRSQLASLDRRLSHSDSKKNS